MTAATSSFIWRNSTSAQLRVWTAGVSALLAAAGLVKTSDTGQINTATVTWTNAVSTLAGYEIWRFNDTLQSTAPIFLRVEYHNSSGGATIPTILVSVGTGTDGAGTLTGLSATGQFPQSQPAAIPPATAIASYACHAEGTLALCLGRLFTAGGVSSNSILTLVIDRARDSAGAVLSSGYLVVSGYPGSTGGACASVAFASTAPTGGAVPCLIPNSVATSGVDGTDVQLFRHYMMMPRVRPAIGCLSYFNNDITALTSVSCTVLGTAHTYLCLGVGATGMSNTGDTNVALAIRYE